MKLNKHLVFFTFGLITVILLLLSFAPNILHVNKVVTITLTTSGFSPKEITVVKGTTVNFKTTLPHSFWPASDPHPVHSIFPQLDAKEPISPEKTWSFTFNKVGSWHFHDHLSPLYKGVINVTEVSNSKSNNSVDQMVTNCKQLNPITIKIQCWENIMNNTIKEKGLNEAFNVMVGLYQSDPAFAANCHSFTHILGENAYDIFSQHKDFQLSPYASYCGYGFYHGFMEALLQRTKDMDQARAFCEFVDMKLRDTSNYASGACYHGIGHGAVDGTDPRAKGNVEKTISPALKLCRLVANDDNKMHRCASGVFNSLAIMYNNPTSGLQADKNHPYLVCDKQLTFPIKKACYEEMNTIVLGLGENNLDKAITFVSDITDKKYATLALLSLSGYYAFLRKDTTTDLQTIQTCRSLEVSLSLACIQGYAGGLVESGSPGKEEEQAIVFCNTQQLTASEKEACYQWILPYLKQISKKRIAIICQNINPQYRKFCN